MKVHFITPYSLSKDLGVAYNQAMSMIPKGDWGCLMDGDTMFLTPDFGTQIHNIIAKYPDTGLFTCRTNRVGNKQQVYQPMYEEVNLKKHREIAIKLQRQHYYDVQLLTKRISGHLMIVKRDTWDRFKFTEGRGMLGVDNLYSSLLLKKGLKIRLMLGVYLLHYYRLNEGKSYKLHLQ